MYNFTKKNFESYEKDLKEMVKIKGNWKNLKSLLIFDFIKLSLTNY